MVPPRNPVLGTRAAVGILFACIHLKRGSLQRCQSCGPTLLLYLSRKATASPTFLASFHYCPAPPPTAVAMNPLTRILAGLPCWSELFSLSRLCLNRKPLSFYLTRLAVGAPLLLTHISTPPPPGPGRFSWRSFPLVFPGPCLVPGFLQWRSRRFLLSMGFISVLWLGFFSGPLRLLGNSSLFYS